MKFLLFLILSSFVNVHAAGSPADESQTGRELYIAINDEIITLKARNIPLRRILSHLAQKNIQIRIDPGIKISVTADFREKNISEVMDRILGKNISHALIWGKNNHGEITLSEIIIYKPGNMAKVTTLETSNKLDLIIDPHTGRLAVKNRFLLQIQGKKGAAKLQKTIKSYGLTAALINPKAGIYQITIPEGEDPVVFEKVLEQMPAVSRMEPDFAYAAPRPVYSASHNTQAASVANPVDDDDQGAATIAVFDTGLLSGLLPETLNKASFDAISGADNVFDIAGHGTQMALIASGTITPKGAASGDFTNPVISIRIFDDNGFTSNSVLIQAMDYAIRNGAKVVSLSWGSDKSSFFLQNAMNYAAENGLVVVAAAGNQPTGKPVYPAAYDNVISVSALTAEGTTWENSNFGNFVDIAAPGFADFPIGYNGAPGTYAGTSISTAWVAGKIAEWIHNHPDQTPSGVKSIKVP